MIPAVFHWLAHEHPTVRMTIAAVPNAGDSVSVRREGSIHRDPFTVERVCWIFDRLIDDDAGGYTGESYAEVEIWLKELA